MDTNYKTLKGEKIMSEKQIVTKKSSAPALYGAVDKSLLDDLSSAEAGDFEFARLTVVQPTSKVPGKPGDIIDSNTNTKVVGVGEKLSFIPLWFFKSFSVSQQKPRKWIRNETKTPENATRSLFDNREDTEENVAVRWDERINLYVILAKDLDEALPTVYRILVKPSSFKEVKKLLMDWEIKKKTGQYPFVYQWAFTPTEASNDQGKFIVLQTTKEVDGDKQKQLTSEQFAGVQYWVKTLVQNRDAIMKVESKLADDVEEAAAPTDGGIKY